MLTSVIFIGDWRGRCSTLGRDSGIQGSLGVGRKHAVNHKSEPRYHDAIPAVVIGAPTNPGEGVGALGSLLN